MTVRSRFFTPLLLIASVLAPVARGEDMSAEDVFAVGTSAGVGIDTRTDETHGIAPETVEELYGEAAWTAPVKAGTYALTHDGDGGTWTARYEVVREGVEVVGDVDLASDATWGADKTWLVLGTVRVGEGATLMIESGATVLQGPGGSILSAGGAVSMEGAKVMQQDAAAVRTQVEGDGVRIDTRTDETHWIAAGAVEELYGKAPWTAPTKAGTYALTHDGDGGTWTARYEVAGDAFVVVGDVDLASDATWGADKTWLVAGTVRIGEGATLTIESGTTVLQGPGGSILSGGGMVSMDAVTVASLDSSAVRTVASGEGARIDTRTDETHWIAAGTVEKLYGEAAWTAPSQVGTYALTHDGDGGTWTAKYEVVGEGVEVVGDVDLASDMVWGADKTWIVAGTVRVEAGATLTIESGATVLQGAGGSILSGGGVVSMEGVRISPFDAAAVRTQSEGDGVRIDTRTDETHWIAGGTVEELYGEAAWTAPKKAGTYALTHEGDGETWTARYEVAGDAFVVVGDVDLASDATWGADKTWLVTGTVRVEEGATLTIESGATVLQGPGGSILSGGGTVAMAGVTVASLDSSAVRTVASGEGARIDTRTDETHWIASGTVEELYEETSWTAPAKAGTYALTHDGDGATWTAKYEVVGEGVEVVGDVDLASDAVWGADKTWLVAGTVRVGEGATLTVESGATILQGPGGSILAGGGAVSMVGVTIEQFDAAAVRTQAEGAGVRIDTRTDETHWIASGTVEELYGEAAWTAPAKAGTYPLTHDGDGATWTARYEVAGETFVVVGDLDVEADTTWGADKTWLVTGTVVVKPGATLTVESGANVVFDVAGSLLNGGGTVEVEGAVFGNRVVDGFLKYGGAAADGVFLDTTAGEVQVAEGVERITYGTEWGETPADSVAVYCIGPDETERTLVAASGPAEGEVEWKPESAGGYDLRHVAGEETLTARFIVPDLAGTIVVRGGSIAGNVEWGTDKTILVAGMVTVADGATLTIARGAVVKFMDGAGIVCSAGGTCIADGVVFTHVNDDTIGGDTLADGDIPPVEDQYALSGVQIDETTQCRYHPDPVATLSGTISANETWRGWNVYCVTGNLTVASGATLTVAPGTVVKFAKDVSLTVASGGTLNAQGTRAQPIVFTSLKDDEHGGDTNGDGDATVAEPGDWKNIKISGKANLAYVSALYGGGASTSSDTGMFTVNSDGTLTLDGCTIAHGLFDGVFSYGSVTGENTVIHDCDRGVNTSGGSGVFKNCVIDMCRWGAMSEGGSGTYYNCIITRFHGSSSWPTGWGLAYWSGALKAYNCCVWSDLDGSSNYRSSPSTANMVLANPLFIDADNGDFRLREESPCVDAGDAEMAPETDQFGQPRVSMEGGAAVADIGVYEVQPRGVAGNVDLVSTRVSADESVVPGGRLNVRWTVENRGGHSTDASRRDTVSLVSANGRTVTLGDVVVSRSAVAGGTVECTADFIVPAIAEGTWYPKVVANSYQDVFEGSLIANNALTGETGVEVQVETTSAGEGASGVVSAGAPTVLKLTFAAGDANRMVVVNVPTGTRVTWGVGFVPTAGGASGGVSGTADAIDNAVQFVVSEEAENVYVVLEGEETGNFVVTTESAKLALAGVAPAEIPSSGETTLAISGAGFMAGTAVRLVGSSATIAVESVRVVDSQTISATVDCGKLAAGGVYDVVVELAGENVTATKAVRVAEVPGEAKFWARLVVPDSVREGRKVTCSVEYGNSGNADMGAPVLQVAMQGTGTLGYVGGLQGVKTLQFIAAGEAGCAGVLRAGSEKHIPFEMVAGKSNRLALSSSIDNDFRPAGWPDAEVYLSALSVAATRVGLRGGDATDYHAVLRLATGVRDEDDVSVVSGRVTDASGTSIEGLILELSNNETNRTAITDSTGGFLFDGLPAGHYEIVAPTLDYTMGTADVTATEDCGGAVYALGAVSEARVRIIAEMELPKDLIVSALPMGESFSNAVFAIQTSDGEFAFQCLEDGLYDIRGMADGFAATTVVEIEDGTVIGSPVTLHLEELHSVTGRVENAVAPDSITVYAVGGMHVSKTTLDEDGRFEFPGLAADEYDFVIVGDEAAVYAPIHAIVLPEGEMEELVFQRADSPENVEIAVMRGGLPRAVDYNKYLFFEVRQVGRHLKEQADLLYRLKTVPLPDVKCAENMATYEHYCDMRRQFGLWKQHYEFMFDLYNQTKGADAAKEGAFLVAKAIAALADLHGTGDIFSSYVTEAENLIDSTLAAEAGIDAVSYAAVVNSVNDAWASGQRAIEVMKSFDFENDSILSTMDKIATVFAELSDMYGAFERMQGFGEMLEAAASKRKANTRLAALAKDYKWQHTRALGVIGVIRSYLSLYKSAKKASETVFSYFFEIEGLRRAANFFGPIVDRYLALDFDGYHDDCQNPIPNPPYPPSQSLMPQVPQSWDPNEMAGPEGAGEKRYVAPGAEMTYTVYFENKATATAAAQEVYVTEQLSGALDWGTFEVVDVGFNNQIDLGLGGKRKGASETAMTGTAYKVRTTLDFDEKTGAAKWYMRIVDERTETRWPKDVFAGFLPPNDGTGRGEGHITYRVKVREDAAAGTVVRASASIVFDYNAAIETDPAWWNTVAEMGEATVDLGNGVSTNVTVMVGAPWGGQLPDPGKRQGMRFAGWFTGPDGTGEEVTEESLVEAGAKLYAFWDASAAPELWLDVSWGAVEIGTNGVVKGYGRDGEAAAGMANCYVLTGTSTVHGVKFAGGSFTNTWTNLVVDLSAKDAVGVALEGAQVEVTLEGDNFAGSGEDCAGIRVDEGSALVLDGPGRLAARGGAYGAGIGGGLEQKSGRIEIRGGTVDAKGGDFGAGIGGGLVGSGAEVVVTGGSVKARGDRGEDIGNGYGEAAGGAPKDGNGAAVHEVEVPFATDTLPVVVAVDLGGGKTYCYEGMGHKGDSSLWFWLPDGTYDFEADGDDYGAHVAGAKAAAVFTDPGAEHFEAPAVEVVEASAEGWRVGLNPAYRTTPFELWTATGLKERDWDWVKVEPSSYRVDAETGAVEWTGAQSEGLRVFKFHFLPKE